MALKYVGPSEPQNTVPMSGDCAMNTFASSNKPTNTTGTDMPYIRNSEVSQLQERMILIFDTILVLSLQLVFRATVMARHLNY
jgi:hypothetical protein